MSLRKQLKTTLSIDKISTLVLAGVLAGCVSTGPVKYDTFVVADNDQAMIQSKASYLQSGYTSLIKEGKRNQVLNLLQIGKTALSNGDIDEAELAFEQALTSIETVYANNPQAEEARSLWYEEGRKDFKGEPYERAMAYFYRGLIYMIRGEFDNARATFLSGIMQDAFAEEEQNRSDFALLMFMAGWASQQMGSVQLAQEAYNELLQFRPDFSIPDQEHDVLIIAETGKSPRKLADGVGHYQLVFRRGKKFQDKRVQLEGANQSIDMYPIEDIYWQASSRGGRPVDKIIEGKAEFKKTAAAFGSGLSSIANEAMVISGGLGSSSGTNAGALFSLVGVASMAMSANAKARADTRYWNNLPDLVHVRTAKSNELGGNVSFAHQDINGNVLFTKPADIVHKADKSSIIWSGSGK